MSDNPATGRLIDPRLSDDLAALLERHEVNADSDAILGELERRGFWVYVSGPDEHASGRWEARTGHAITDTRRQITRGDTPRIALARLFAWVVGEETA